MRLLISLVLLFTFSPYVGALTSLDRAELSFPNSLQDSNPGFESGTVKWTGSGGTFTINSTAADQFVAGSKQFAVWDSDGAAQERCSALVKVPESGNCAVSLTYKVPSGTATHKIVAKDGSKDLSVEDVVSSTAAWRHDVEFPCAAAASNQARVCLRSVASNEPAIQFDSGYAGEARQVSKCGVDTPWVSYSPVITGLGTGSATITGMWRGTGDSIEASFMMTMTSNGSGASAVEISIPTQFTMNASKFLSSGGPRGAAFSQATTILTCGANSSSNKIVLATNSGAATGSALVNGNIVRCSVNIPVNERTASQCVTPERQRTPRVVMYTSGSGTYIPSPGVTYIEVYARGGGGGAGGGSTGGTGTAGGSTSFGSLTIGGGEPGSASDGGFPGTVSGTLPSGGSWLQPSLQQGGTGNSGAYTTGGNGGGAEYTCPGKGRNSNSAQGGCASGGGGAGGGTSSGSVYGGGGGGAGGTAHFLVSAPASSYSFSIGAGGAAASPGSSVYSGSNGSAGFIRIVEYFGYGTALLANSVSSSVTNGARMIWASVNSVCSASPCTIGAQSGDFTSITRAGTGGYQANFNAGTFSGTPVCTCSTVGALDGHCSAYGSTTSSSTVRTYTPTGSAQDGYIEMMCIGPR